MLQILLGFRTDSRTVEIPQVLYIGHQASDLEAAVSTAAPDLIRLERAYILDARKVRRPEPAISEPSVEWPLEGHTIEELRALAAEEHIPLTGLHLKAEILDAITLARTPLAERTIEQLRALAEVEGIDLTGLTLKADILAAFAARVSPQSHETPAADEPVMGAAAASSGDGAEPAENPAPDDGPALDLAPEGGRKRRN